MVIADNFDVIAPGVAVWRAYDPAVKCDLWSTAVLREDAWVLIDPVELEAPKLAELLGEARVSAVVLTSGNHARSAEAFRSRHAVQLWAPADAAPVLEITVDECFSERDSLPGGLRAIAIPSAGPGEVALLDGAGLLCFGDAVINFGSAGFSLLPAKYCANPAQLPNDLRKLLSYDARILTFAHGDPIVQHATERLQSLLA
jgi:glyoxylase-like metal-dependent hydrolase (beta-lactamase superfamily II)